MPNLLLVLFQYKSLSPANVEAESKNATLPVAPDPEGVPDNKSAGVICTFLFRPSLLSSLRLPYLFQLRIVKILLPFFSVLFLINLLFYTFVLLSIQPR